MWYGIVWYGVVWYGVVWFGMVCYGMIWYGVGLPVSLKNGFMHHCSLLVVFHVKVDILFKKIGSNAYTDVLQTQSTPSYLQT